jgi:transcriptional regulator with XRE-family HTH domain
LFSGRVSSPAMVETPPKNPRIRRLLVELRGWCTQERGRQAAVARAMGVFPQTVSDWFSEKKQPTGEQALAIQEFLRKQRRASRRGEKDGGERKTMT